MFLKNKHDIYTPNGIEVSICNDCYNYIKGAVNLQGINPHIYNIKNV